jgi:carbamate kinase
MRMLIALGGNALLRRGEAMTTANQIDNIHRAAVQIARLAEHHQLLVTHGNGPQVGLLALQAAAGKYPGTPLDVLDAESEGMIGYLLEQETLLTRVEVRADDPGFGRPSKPIGPLYTQQDAERLAAQHGWSIAADGTSFRRVVASPRPQRIVELASICCLLEHGVLVIAAGGGGIPVQLARDGTRYTGVEAVIDKDLCSALLAADTHADLLLIATDVDAIYSDWHTPREQALRSISATQLRTLQFAAGSMGPKVDAACGFVLRTGKPAVIGSLEQIEQMAQGTAGTRVTA